MHKRIQRKPKCGFYFIWNVPFHGYSLSLWGIWISKQPLASWISGSWCSVMREGHPTANWALSGPFSLCCLRADSCFTQICYIQPQGSFSHPMVATRPTGMSLQIFVCIFLYNFLPMTGWVKIPLRTECSPNLALYLFYIFIQNMSFVKEEIS